MDTRRGLVPRQAYSALTGLLAGALVVAVVACGVPDLSSSVAVAASREENAGSTAVTVNYSGCSGGPSHDFVVENQDAVFADSGTTSSCQYTTPEGALSPGGTYEAYVAKKGQTKRSTTPTFNISSNGKSITTDGLMGPDVTAEDVLEDPSVTVTNTAAVTSTHGLRTRFWPTTTTTQGQGSSIEPRGGAQTADIDVPDPTVHDAVLGTKTAECVRGSCTPSSYVLTEISYTIGEKASPSSSASAAAYDIAGTNVAPSLQTVLTSDSASGSEGGLSFSTADDSVVSVAFGLRQQFGFKGLAYLEVPESGDYTFGGTSPGGIRAYVYKTTDTDLGRNTVLDDWSPATGACSSSVRIDRKQTYTSMSGNVGGGQITYTWPSETNPDWDQPTDEEIDKLNGDFASSCAAPESTRFGSSVHLDKGVLYPFEVQGYFGFSPGSFAIDVKTPAGTTERLPYSWLYATSSSVTGFERSTAPTTSTTSTTFAASLNGFGNQLAVGADTHTELYATAGSGSWSDGGPLTYEGQALGFQPTEEPDRPFPSPKSLAFDDQGDTLAVAPTTMGGTDADGQVLLFTRRSSGEQLSSTNADVQKLSDVVAAGGSSWSATIFNTPSLVAMSSNGLVVVAAAYIGNADKANVAVVSRPSLSSPWTLSSFKTVTLKAGSRFQYVGYQMEAVAAGADGDTGYVALSNGTDVEILSGRSGDKWSTTKTITSTQVTDLALDYSSQHLAVASPAAEKVTIFRREGTAWSEQHTLDFSPSEFSQAMTVNYSYGLLAVADNGTYLSTFNESYRGPTLTLYKDLDGDWQSYADWTKLTLPSSSQAGPVGIVTTGAESVTTPVVVGAATGFDFNLTNPAPAFSTYNP